MLLLKHNFLEESTNTTRAFHKSVVPVVVMSTCFWYNVCFSIHIHNVTKNATKLLNMSLHNAKMLSLRGLGKEEPIVSP